MSQAESNRSICSTPGLNLPELRTPQKTSSSGRHKKKPCRDDEKRETSFSGSSYSNSDEDNGEYQSSHTCSNSASDNENEDDDDEDDDTTITGALGSRLHRFCWALCCACSDCCRCKEPSCSRCSCCRTRNFTRDELSGIEIENDVLMLDNDNVNKDNRGKCKSCVGCLQRTWTRWIRLKVYVRDKVEFAENGKNTIYKFVNQIVSLIFLFDAIIF